MSAQEEYQGRRVPLAPSLVSSQNERRAEPMSKCEQGVSAAGEVCLGSLVMPYTLLSVGWRGGVVSFSWRQVLLPSKGGRGRQAC